MMRRAIPLLIAGLLALGLLAAMLTDNGYGGFSNSIPGTAAELDASVELASRFAPVLRMHPDERFMPQDVAALVENAALRDQDGEVILAQGNVTSEELGKYTGEEHAGYYLDVPDAIDAEPQPGYPVKVYAAVQEGSSSVVPFDHRVYLQYWLFYFADYLNPSLVQGLCRDLYDTVRVPSGTPLIGGKCEPHEADWELIQLEFDAEGVADILGNDIEPGRISYSRHYWSEDRSWQTTPTVDRHPIAYVSLAKHANYFGSADGGPVRNPSGQGSEGRSRSVALVQDLISDGGRELLPPALSDRAAPCRSADPKDLQACTYTLQWIDAATPWVAFKGKWGDHRVDGPDDPVRWDRPYLWAGYGHGIQVLFNPESREIHR